MIYSASGDTEYKFIKVKLKVNQTTKNPDNKILQKSIVLIGEVDFILVDGVYKVYGFII